MIVSMDLHENLYVKCTNLSTTDQFLCDIFTCKHTKVVGYHQSGASHRSRTNQHRRKQTLLLLVWIFFVVLFWLVCLFLVCGFF